MFITEENPINLRTLVWATPPQPPKIAELRTLTQTSELGSNFVKIIKGIIFWKVKNINKDPQSIILTSLMTQLWNGAAPSLINNPTVKALLKSNENFIKTLLKRIIIEAKVWIRKYLIELSLDRLDLYRSKRGRKAKVFSSNPIQHNNKELKDMTIKILKKILNINKTRLGETPIIARH